MIDSFDSIRLIDWLIDSIRFHSIRLIRFDFRFVLFILIFQSRASGTQTKLVSLTHFRTKLDYGRLLLYSCFTPCRGFIAPKRTESWFFILIDWWLMTMMIDDSFGSRFDWDWFLRQNDFFSDPSASYINYFLDDGYSISQLSQYIFYKEWKKK